MLTSASLKMSSFSSEEGVHLTPRKGVELHGIVACGGDKSFCYFPEKD